MTSQTMKREVIPCCPQHKDTFLCFLLFTTFSLVLSCFCDVLNIIMEPWLSFVFMFFPSHFCAPSLHLCIFASHDFFLQLFSANILICCCIIILIKTNRSFRPDNRKGVPVDRTLCSREQGPLRMVAHHYTANTCQYTLISGEVFCFHSCS